MNAWTVTNCVAGNKRDELAKFWLACPDDILENLWHSPVGDATRQLVAQLTPSTYLSPSQIEQRERISRELQVGLQQPGAVKKLIANFLFSPPGQMRIANPQANLPSWLIAGYVALYEQEYTGFVEQPQGRRSPEKLAPAVAQNPSGAPKPDFGAAPNTLEEFSNNRIQLNRLLGLSNLYYIDPEDQEILQELQQIRLQVCDLILKCPEEHLERLFTSDLGDRFWAMVRSGIQKEPLLSEEEKLKSSVTARLNPSHGGGFGTNGAVNAFLVAMALYEPGSMQVEDAEKKLPTWLFNSYKEIFSKALSS